MQIHENIKYSDSSQFGVCANCHAGLIHARGEVYKDECDHLVVCEKCNIIHAQMPSVDEIQKILSLLSTRGKLMREDSTKSRTLEALMARRRAS